MIEIDDFIADNIIEWRKLFNAGCYEEAFEIQLQLEEHGMYLDAETGVWLNE